MSNVRACKPGCLCRPACRRACVHAYLYIYIYRYRYIDIDIYIYICIYVCVCVSVCVSVSLFVRVCVCVAFAAEFMQKLENIFAPVCSRKLAFPSFPSFPRFPKHPWRISCKKWVWRTVLLVSASKNWVCQPLPPNAARS